MEVGLFVDHLLQTATLRRASDIHLQPKEKNGEILFRIDGYLSKWQTCSRDQLRAVISKFKYTAHLDIGEKRLPQDGSLQQTLHQQPVQLRLSTMPTIYGEKLVIRIFPQQRDHFPLAQLGFTVRQLQLLHHLIGLPHGLILLTGPTGSGKTTTMYQILQTLVQSKGKNICSLEDPVEMRIPSLTQVQVHPQQGFTFAKGLRSMLRQDPDVIFVGEIRDEETAEITVRAALTGHLVFSTLHTPGVYGAIARLLEMGIKPYYVSSALTGVITQRLYRLLCPYCTDGCYACFHTGYLGRKGVFEMLSVDQSLRTAIRDGADEDSLRQASHHTQNMESLKDHLLRQYAAGFTTEEECLSLV